MKINKDKCHLSHWMFPQMPIQIIIVNMCLLAKGFGSNLATWMKKQKLSKVNEKIKILSVIKTNRINLQNLFNHQFHVTNYQIIRTAMTPILKKWASSKTSPASFTYKNKTFKMNKRRSPKKKWIQMNRMNCSKR